MTSWKHLTVPKKLGGWWLENIHLFSQALATKNAWGVIDDTSLWPQVKKEKYFRIE